MTHMINLDLSSKVLCYKSYPPSLCSLKSSESMGTRTGATSSGRYTKEKNHKSNLISVTYISLLCFDCSLSLRFKTMKAVILSVILVLGVWLDCFSCDSHFTSGHVN